MLWVLAKRLRDPEDELFYGEAAGENIAAELADRGYNIADKVFWVPDGSRGEDLRSAAKQTDIGKRIDYERALIETENPKDNWSAAMGCWQKNPTLSMG